MSKPVDYSLYLVTDSTMIPESSTFIKQVAGAINNGATIVQLREKSILTKEFIERARQVQKLTRKKKIPLIINDRVDVALAVGADGIHVGQDDMPAKLVRKLIGLKKILGVTCSNVDQLKQVLADGVADYVGLGTVYATATKKDVDDPLGTGPIGIRKMLDVLYDHHEQENAKQLKCVAIGGINHDNAAKVLKQCKYNSQGLDGIAVVSCIMAAPRSDEATKSLLKLIKSNDVYDYIEDLEYCALPINYCAQLLKQKPLVHHITNNVVKNFSANITLAIGASPIMSEFVEEFEEFTSIEHIALLINLGTPSKPMMDAFLKALEVYNRAGKPVVFDPVACGATKARLECCRTILNAGQVQVLKGNAGEIAAIYKLTTAYKDEEHVPGMKGVDSVNDLPKQRLIQMGHQIAKDFKCCVVITGEVDHIVSQKSSCSLYFGHELLTKITGTGCSLGSVIAAFLAVSTLEGVLSLFETTMKAVEHYTHCAKRAADKTPENANGTFMINFIDELSTFTKGLSTLDPYTDLRTELFYEAFTDNNRKLSQYELNTF